MSRGTYLGSALRPLWERRARLPLGSWMWLWALAPHLENKDQQGTHLTGSGE